MRMFLIVILLIALLQVFVPSAFAQQNQLQLLAPLPTLNSNVINFGPGCYIQRMYQFGLGIGGALAMLMIVWGAVQWTISGAVDKKAAAKSKITKAILGLVLLVASVLILNIVSPNLTTFNDIVPPLAGAAQAQQCN